MTAHQTVDRPMPLRDARPMLDRQSAKRLCIDLIASEQDRLLREKRLSRRQHVERWVHCETDDALERLEIGEHTLGFDSLGLLDLVSVVSRYFHLMDSGAEDLLLVHRELGQWAGIVVAHLDRIGEKARIGFETSGSTGNPKRVVHGFGVLEDEVSEIRHAILGPAPAAGRILSAVPPRHIYGFLWSVLLSGREGLEVIELHRASEGAIARLSQPGDIVLGTPYIWERTARAGGRLPSGVTGISSAGPSSPATWQAARSLGVERFVEIYGSTETGGLGWRNAWDHPFTLSARVVRDGGELRRHACGTLLPVQDHLRWLDDTRFTVAGRCDDVVQVAGTNVSLNDVERCLRGIAGVAEAAVRLEGDRIRALIVAGGGAADTEALEDALRASARRHLAAPARPERYTFAPALPRTELGKLADW
jgi:4-coumarate--CoA ligase (photoactive yellow protein activation family)